MFDDNYLLDFFFEYRKNLRDRLRTYLVNETFSLNERWESFISSKDLLPVELYGSGQIEVLDNRASLYDDFYIERHSTISIIQVNEHLLDNFSILDKKTDSDVKSYNKFEKYSQNYDKWREAVLAAGYSGFIYDW